MPAKETTTPTSVSDDSIRSVVVVVVVAVFLRCIRQRQREQLQPLLLLMPMLRLMLLLSSSLPRRTEHRAGFASRRAGECVERLTDRTTERGGRTGEPTGRHGAPRHAAPRRATVRTASGRHPLLARGQAGETDSHFSCRTSLSPVLGHRSLIPLASPSRGR